VARGDQCLDVPLVLERGESPVLQVWRRVGVRIVDHSRYKGVRVARVDPTGPAARLGLREGDLIDGVDERLLDGTADLVRSVHDLPGGTAVTIHVWRGREAWAGSLTLR
jgi:S1-C subfamily serine protease